MKVLQTAVVGLGRIGWQFHIPEIRRHKGFRLVAVVDPLEERRAEASATLGGDVYGDTRDLWKAHRDIDLLVIASPTLYHAPHAIEAFRNGADVFCDKPMAPSLAEADRMIAAMRRHRRKLMLYQPHRAGSDLLTLKAALGKELIGPVYMIKRCWSDYTRRNDWQAFRKNGGGMLNNYGAHVIDQVLHLAGSRARRIVCRLRSIATLGDADDVVKMVIETENGAILDVDINMASAHSMDDWRVIGKRGSLVFDGVQKAWRARYLRREDLGRVGLQEGLAAQGRRYGSGEKLLWKEAVFSCAKVKPIDFYAKCYDFFALGKKPFVPIEETRELMRVLDACRRDSEASPNA